MTARSLATRTFATRTFATRSFATALALALLALGAATSRPAFFAAALPAAAWALLAAFAVPPRLELEARRAASARISAADRRVGVTVTVRNLGPRIEALTLEDRLPTSLAAREIELGPAPGRGAGATCEYALRDTENGLAVRWRGSLDPASSVELSYSLRAARGFHELGDLVALAEAPLSGASTLASLPCPLAIAIHPAIRRLGKEGLGRGAPRAFAGASLTRRDGAGTDFSGTRDYCPGDPLRALNWRAEALWGLPVVNVFEEERAIDALVVLDARAVAYESRAEFEEAAAAALTLAEAALDRGGRVAFLCYGSSIAWTPPGFGREHRLRLRLAAAKAELGDHVAFEELDNIPLGLFPPRCMAIVVSPLLPDDVGRLRALEARGHPVLVYRRAEADEPSQPAGDRAAAVARRIVALEEKILLSRLARSGIRCAGLRA